MRNYDHQKIEKKWQKEWAQKKLYQTKDVKKGAKNFYLLVEFPYPSGNLHVGHWYAFAVPDILARHHRMLGKNVLYPIGFDAFGLPAENAAIKNNINPKKWTYSNIAYMEKQIESMGTSFDWSRKVVTADPDYYKWTQWLFLQFFKKGLAYKKETAVNWCPKDKTVLANEQVVDGKCERCDSEVEQRKMLQWNLKITDYADRLIDDLTPLDWPEQIKNSQRNWIGRSEGAEIDFFLDFGDEKINARTDPQGKKAHIKVFTTRPDTLFGATYLVLSPEHPWVQLAIDDHHKGVLKNQDEVRKYVIAAGKMTELERQENKEKTGVKLEGVEAINPATSEKIPLYVADYVLAHYGTGAIMAVPAHDERDGEFAKKFNIPIKQVIALETGITRENEERRDGGCAVIFDPKTQKYAVAKNPLGIYGLFAGGIKEGESFRDGILREVREESGLHDFAYDEEIGATFSHFHNPRKNVNRVALAKCMLIILRSADTKEVQLEAHEDFTLHWTDAEDILDNWRRLDTDKNRDHWDQFVKQAVGRARELGYDTTNTDSKFRTETYTGDGVLINSGEFDGVDSKVAKEKMTEKFGTKKTTYKMRDWVVSRQRYWGVPIPVIHCPKCGDVAVPDKDLPVKLPEVRDYLPTGDGKSPLAKATKWVQVACPSCIEKAQETKYLIFDFDGVLGDTVNANIEARIRMGDAKTLEESRAAMEKYFSSKPWHTRDVKMSDADTKRYHDWSYRYAVEVSKMKWKLFDGFVNEVKKIKKVKIAIVSAGHEMYSKDKLRKSGIKYTHFLAGNHDRSKENKIELIAKAWNVDIKDVYYFTDALSDVYELENLLNREKIIGCAWGYLGKEKLLKGLPERQILNKYSDIHSLWKPLMGTRETDTFDTFVDSSWYFQRYIDPKNKKKFADAKKLATWMPIDLYSGGAEHTTMHLLYSRFWHKAMFDLGLVKDSEPYTRRMNRSLIMGPDGQKMSKSRGNVIDPDEVVRHLGADTVRMYLAFIGPYNEVASYPWNPSGVVGVRRFLERVWRLHDRPVAVLHSEVERALHVCIKKMTEDMPQQKFNTSIAAMMIFLNEAETKGITRGQYEVLLRLLAPFAPHMSEELWRTFGNKKSIHLEKWPSYDAAKVRADIITMVVQINGKVRAQFETKVNTIEADARAEGANVAAKWLEGKQIKKVVYVPNRLINFVLDESK